ncbi:MAG: EFR1 family ferrodoxin [Clostridia bacterium]|nr:EFR1 family ferrodoxin [Clostridia bacterium]
MINKVRVIYFSPNGSTKTLAEYLAKAVADSLAVPWESNSYTLPKEREQKYIGNPNELIIWASPVYAGRIPNKTLDYVKSAFQGNGAMVVPLVVFGNRSYDGALAELCQIMKASGGKVVGACALVAEHAFSGLVGKARPDLDDYLSIDKFVSNLLSKLESGDMDLKSEVPGDVEHYYVPKKENGDPANFLKAHPKVNEEICLSCAMCESKCPMGSIKFNGEHPRFEGICIKCQACRKSCPADAIYFDDEDFLSHVRMLENEFRDRKENEFYL